MLLTQGKHQEDFMHYWPSAGRCWCTSWRARSHHRFPGKIKAMIMNEMPWPASSSFLWAFITEHNGMWCGMCPWVSCPGCDCSEVHAHPWEAAREPQHRAVFSSSWNPTVLPTLTQAQTKHITIQAAMRRVNSIPAWPLWCDYSWWWVRSC